MTPADLALVLRRQGETVSLGGLAGLLAEAGLRVESVRVERGRAGSWSQWVASITRAAPDGIGRFAYEGQGATMALALADACERVAS